MPSTTVLLIILALLIALALAAFQYFYKAKGGRLQNILFGILRFITLFCVFLLLINPKIRKTEYFTEKPKLILAVDNSASISYLQQSEQVKQFVNTLTEDTELQERFDINVYSFGTEINEASELDFGEKQTNISQTLKELNPLYDGNVAPTILITDGNQTLGEDFLYSTKRYPQALYPVVIGDTASYQDLAVSRVNVNQYAFLNNRFPVEVMVSYSGKEDVISRVAITSGQNTVFSQNLDLEEHSTSAVIRAELPASSVGVHTYTIKVDPLPGEKNTMNNTREFAVEVIDERSSILVFYQTLHPDLGTLKKVIESNEQREVFLKRISDRAVNPEDFQLVILYQPSTEFVPILKELQEKNRNYWVITGPETNWRTLNNQQDLFRQEITGQTEEFLPVFNENFNLFQADDLNFSRFPPLTGNFGDLTSEQNVEILLFKDIQGIETTDPLLAISEENGSRRAFLFGVNIWKWRSHIYREQGSFEPFDNFFGKLIQFLSSGIRKERLTVSYEPLYRGSEELLISAKYFGRNYVFNGEANLNLHLKNVESGELRQIPFLLRNNNYEVDLSNLLPGEYSFTLQVEGEDLSRSGSFKLLSFDVEKQFSGANTSTLKAVAGKNGEQLYFPDKPEELKKELLSSKSYLPVQKSRENDVPLIDWFYLLIIIVLALSGEWLLRKYYGHI